MMTKMSGVALVVAAGSSRRMGFNKLLADLCGRPVLWHSLRAFELCAEIERVVLVAGDEVAAVAEGWRSCGELKKLEAPVAGGAERHLSVWAGLQALGADADLVAVHDGARPLIEPGQISRCLAVAAETGAAVCARALTETIKRVDADGVVVGALERDGVWVMETPQVFQVDLLRRAYERVMAAGELVTDEVSAVQQLGVGVRVVANGGPNVKVTFPEDLALAEKLLNAAGLVRLSARDD